MPGSLLFQVAVAETGDGRKPPGAELCQSLLGNDRVTRYVGGNGRDPGMIGNVVNMPAKRFPSPLVVCQPMAKRGGPPHGGAYIPVEARGKPDRAERPHGDSGERNPEQE